VAAYHDMTINYCEEGCRPLSSLEVHPRRWVPVARKRTTLLRLYPDIRRLRKDHNVFNIRVAAEGGSLFFLDRSATGKKTATPVVEEVSDSKLLFSGEKG